jgi:tetratricopeptide (TPR) repeat protein
MILFASCIPDALERAPGLVLEAPAKLVPLFTRSFAGAEVRAAAPGYPPWLQELGDLAAAIPAGSLMGCFRRSAADFPARTAYLRADPVRVARWRERLAELGPGPKVGLSWGGGFYRTGRKGRTLAPEDLAPLLGHSQVHFVSLQYTPGAAEEAAELGARRGRPVYHWPEAIADYEETAALVSALDLVVTVCTAAAHLSGALGQRVWILAPESASWRYLGSGEDLPWYPTARVFRRAPGGTWRSVVERVADTLGADLGLAPRAAAADPGLPRVASPDPPPSSKSEPAAASREEALLGHVRTLWARGEREAAIESLESSLASEPAWADGWHELGKLYAALSRLREARDCLELALHHDPRHLAVLELAAKLSESATANALAAGYLARACEVAPQRPDLRVRLAKAQYLLGALGEAQASARRAIEIDPASVDAHVVLGVAQIGLEDYPAAVDALESAVRLAPAIVSGHLNLANAYLHAGRFAEAKARLRWVITHEPNNFIARWDYAHLKLASREFEEGWSHYEFRKQAIHVAGKTLSLPEWRGQPLADGTGLVILREQGLGDEIMFASCMPDVLSRVRDCVLQCDARLAKLFARSFPGVRTVVGDAVRTALGEAAGYEVSAGTLPVLFRRNEQAFPAHCGYLRADAARVADWRQRLAALGPGLKVGLSWRGGSAHTRTRLRSIPLPDLAPVLRVPGCHFVSLQYGAVEEDIATLAAEPGLEVVHFPEAIADYDETAALVSALDVVVTVCTSIVHLTGAVGRPVWVLVPSVPEWRYCFDGETLPWYPTARLIRQRAGEPWAQPIAEAARRLRALMGVVPR